MKYKNPRKEIRKATWTRIPAPDNFFKRMELKYKLRDYESDGHYWVNTIYTHFWIEKETDAAWFMLTT